MLQFFSVFWNKHTRCIYKMHLSFCHQIKYVNLNIMFVYSAVSAFIFCILLFQINCLAIMVQSLFYNNLSASILLQFETFRCKRKIVVVGIVDRLWFSSLFFFWNIPSKMFRSYCLAFCFIAWISICSGDDVVVQMFSKKPVNYISEKYISYSIDPIELLEMSKEKEWVVKKKTLV